MRIDIGINLGRKFEYWKYELIMKMKLSMGNSCILLTDFKPPPPQTSLRKKQFGIFEVLFWLRTTASIFPRSSSIFIFSPWFIEIFFGKKACNYFYEVISMIYSGLAVSISWRKIEQEIGLFLYTYYTKMVKKMLVFFLR